ncbi:MAG: DUF4868 domain-containing protein [Clostridia bacterium]|nr:DUF4868 domain-containing protein [Clostridia bacterium]
MDLLDEISKVYLGNGKKAISLYQEVREYDGTTDSRTIYKLNTDSELINAEFNTFLASTATPNTEEDPFNYKSAYLIKGQISVGGSDVAIKMISMQTPVTTLKNKYWFNKGKFEEYPHRVLSLRPTIDVIIVDTTVYFLTFAGENLFNMERAYKKECANRIQEIESADILIGMDNFRRVAETGHNPRRFVSFNQKKLNALKKKSVIKQVAKQFSIPLDETETKFDATAEGAAEKIVKFLCNKGMIDPIEKIAVEVDSARQWQK